MKIVITAATQNEWSRINENINRLYVDESRQFHVSFHRSGVGILASTFSLSKLVIDEKPDLVIQVGIAGSFDTSIETGTVVAVRDEFLGDTGVEESGQFKDVFDLSLEKENAFPFSKKALTNSWLNEYNLLGLDTVTSVTINEVTTRRDRAEQLIKKYRAEIETMEGAPFHYVCLQTATPFIQTRAISNYIGERDKSKWDFKNSLGNLQTTTLRYLDKLYNMK